MSKYMIENDKDDEVYFKKFKSSNECRHWIINHLDLSKNWKFCNGLYFVNVNINWDNKTIIL